MRLPGVVTQAGHTAAVMVHRHSGAPRASSPAAAPRRRRAASLAAAPQPPAPCPLAPGCSSESQGPQNRPPAGQTAACPAALSSKRGSAGQAGAGTGGCSSARQWSRRFCRQAGQQVEGSDMGAAGGLGWVGGSAERPPAQRLKNASDLQGARLGRGGGAVQGRRG